MARILHIGKFYPPFAGGMENFLADLVLAQQQVGDEIAVLVHDHQVAWRRSFASIQPECTSPYPIYRAPCYGRLLYAPISPQFGFWLNHVIQDFQPDVLHFHLPNTSAFFAWLSPAARRLPWVVHWHSDVISTVDHRLAWAYHVYRPFEQAFLARAKAIIATSIPYLQTSPALQSWLQKTYVIPLGLNVARLPKPNSEMLAWAEAQWQGQETRVLQIGRLTYYKGQQVLLEAFTQLPHLQLLIVGTGELKTSLEQYIHKQHLHHTVRLLGYCPEAQLQALLTTCDIFCLPSIERTEAFGMVLLEAMHYAKPIVASDVAGSGMTWVVQAGKTGLLVSPQSATALREALLYLHEQVALRHNYGQAGQQRFSQTFDILSVAQQIHSLYQKVESY